MDIYYRIIKLIFRSYHVLLFQKCLVNGEYPVRPGPKIIAGNHPNATDGFYLPSLFKEKLYFFVQGDLFNIPIMGWLFTKSGQIHVDPDHKIAALDRAVELLKQGESVAIFPEARLNPDGQHLKSSTGAVRLSLMTNTPIIPIGFYVPAKNLQHFSRMKKGAVSQGHWQTHGQCYLHFGSPWSPRDETDASLEQADLRGLTDRLMEMINDQAQLAMQVYAKETGLPVNVASFNDH
jgi:1-acyl-sn-glycerol-3-phosphate acyltransferase